MTTNVCSGGIDIEQVTLAVNFDLPIAHDTQKADCETYLHRIERSVFTFRHYFTTISLIY